MKHDAHVQAAIGAGHPECAELPASAAEARELEAAGWPPDMPKLRFSSDGDRRDRASVLRARVARVVHERYFLNTLGE